MKLQGRTGCGEGLVEFKNAVVGVEFVPDEVGAHTDHIGQAGPNVSRNRPRPASA